jgi:hypothetical protein
MLGSVTTTGPGGDGSDDRARDEPDLAVPGTRSLGSDVSAEDAREFDDDELLEEFGGSDEVSIDADPVGLDDPVEVEDVMLGSWSDDDDALGTESGGFGPDRPRDARMPGLYSSGEIDDVRADGDVHDDDLVGQGQDGD